MQSYEELKQLRYLSTKHDVADSAKTTDSLMLSPNSTDELFVSKNPHDETDLVLYQFESSFASLAESAAFVLNNSIRSSHYTFPVDSSTGGNTRQDGNSKLLHSYDSNNPADDHVLNPKNNELPNSSTNPDATSVPVGDASSPTISANSTGPSNNSNSITDLSNTSDKVSEERTGFNATGSSTADPDALLMSLFLDKYSDKLVDLLSEKIQAKLSTVK